MSTDFLEAVPFVPPALPPLKAHIQNVLCTRSGPVRFTLGEIPCTFQFVGILPDFEPVFILRVKVGAELWKVEAGSLEILKLHPLTTNIDPDAELPEEFTLALLEALFAPLLDKFSLFLGIDCVLTGNENETQELFSLPFLFTFSTKQEALSASLASTDLPDTSAIPVRISIPSKDAALLLAERMATLPQRKKTLSDIPINVGLEAGRMTLPATDLKKLEVSDILLPDEFPAAQDKIILRISNSLNALCSLSNNQVTVLECPYTACSEEPHMTHPEDTPSQTQVEAAKTESPQIEDLELTISFELERRLITVGDLAALAPGYTFALGVLPDAPVTLRVSGRDIGTGRLVDLKGTLGVQILSLKNGGEHS